MHPGKALEYTLVQRPKREVSSVIAINIDSLIDHDDYQPIGGGSESEGETEDDNVGDEPQEAAKVN